MTREPLRAGGARRPLPRWGRSVTSDDAGMVIVETAIAIPALAVVAASLAWAVSIGAASLALGDAARAAARDIARGEAASTALARAGAEVPYATLTLGAEGSSAVVVATREVRAPVPGLSGVSVTITQRVAIPKEWL